MDKAFVEKWVRALRSGDYNQIRTGNYKTADGFCCLGVAIELLGGDPEYGDSNHVIKQVVPTIHDPIPSLPMARKGKGMGYEQQTVWCNLSAMNDGTGIYEGDERSFDQIADFIEEKLLAA